MTESSPAVPYERAGFVARVPLQGLENWSALSVGMMTGLRESRRKGK